MSWSFGMLRALKRRSFLSGSLLLCLFLSTGIAPSQSPTVRATINVSRTGPPISPYLYGMFLEHGGDIVNTGLWSEMLTDRKFFYPVQMAAPTPPPAVGNAAGNPRFRNIPTRWWSPIGGDGVVAMDSKDPYTGDHAPLVELHLSVILIGRIQLASALTPEEAPERSAAGSIKLPTKTLLLVSSEHCNAAALSDLALQISMRRSTSSSRCHTTRSISSRSGSKLSTL